MRANSLERCRGDDEAPGGTVASSVTPLLAWRETAHRPSPLRLAGLAEGGGHAGASSVRSSSGGSAPCSASPISARDDEEGEECNSDAAGAKAAVACELKDDSLIRLSLSGAESGG